VNFDEPNALPVRRWQNLQWHTPVRNGAFFTR